MRAIIRLTAVLLLAFGAAACSNTAPVNTALTNPPPSHQKFPDGPTWPRYRGANDDGISTQKGINKAWNQRPPTLLWRQALTDGGYAGYSVANGLVYIIDHAAASDIVRAFDLGTGDEKWRYTYADAATSNYGFSRATPTVDGNHVYTYSRLGKLTCLDATGGQLIWQKDVIATFNGHRPGWDMATSPLIDGDKIVVYAGGDNAAVVALNKATGDTIWAGGGSDKPGYSSPVLATINGARQYVCALGTSVIGVDAASGKLLWSLPWKTGADVNAANPLVSGDSVFIASGYGHGCALIDISAAGPQIRWQNKEMQAHFSSPILAGGYIYGTGNPGWLECLDPQTGNTMWKQDGFEKGGLIGVDGTLVVFDGSNGDLVMVALTQASYQEIGRFSPLGGQSWTAPVVACGRLVVRNKTTLACFDAM